LRRIDARELDHRQPNLAVHRQQFGAQRILKALERVLGGAIGRLQRNAAVGERRADEHDRPRIARQHVLERGASAVDLAEESHVVHPAEFLEAHVHEPREDSGECVVDPDVDVAELGGHLARGALDLLGVGNVGLEDQGAAAELLDLFSRGLQPVEAARDQRNRAAAPGKLARRCSPYARRSAGDDSNLGHSLLPKLLNHRMPHLWRGSGYCGNGHAPSGRATGPGALDTCTRGRFRFGHGVCDLPMRRQAEASRPPQEGTQHACHQFHPIEAACPPVGRIQPRAG
jgi:hypothetical protein